MSKLNEAKKLVDDLKSKAAKQSKVLAEKQAEADQSLKDITATMVVSAGIVITEQGYTARNIGDMLSMWPSYV